MLEISTIELKHRTALAGMKMLSKGIWTMIYRVVISIHSFFIETPRKIDKKRLVEIAPDRAELVPDAIVVKAFVAAEKLLLIK